jgi:O-antigen/teichoic acid export membrane protein
MTLLSPWAFALLFGEQWRAAGTLVQAMSLMYLCQIVAYPLSQTLILLERQRLQILWDAARVTLTVASLWLPRLLGAGIVTSVVVYSLAMAAAYAVHFAMMWMALRHRCRTALADEGADR